MSDLALLPATALAARIRERKVGAVEALAVFEERYHRLNPALNAIVAVNFEAARSRAEAAEAALAKGEIWGPLHGLPMTLKDNIETVHLPTTYGAPQYAGNIAPANADVAQRLHDAGAVVFGKTNLPAFGTDTQSFNDLHGQSNNPWNLEYTPGGSSGGAAAALAAGLTPLEIGNDIGGSIRIPANFCGIYGHKSSFGLVSMNGPKPWEKSNHQFPVQADLLVNGPLARTASDLTAVLDIIAGPPANQRAALRTELTAARADTLQEFRVGVWLDEADNSPASDVADQLQAAVDALARAGANILEARPDISLRRAHSLRNELEATTLSYTCPQNLYDQAIVDADKDDGKRRAMTWAQSVTLRYRDWHQINRERLIMQQKWHEFFSDYDVLLCPITRIAAHPHDHTPLAERSVLFEGRETPYWPVMGPWNALALVAGLPATAAPVDATPAGLPVGMQIIGPYYEDKTPLRFAELLEQEITGPFQFPPGYAD